MGKKAIIVVIIIAVVAVVGFFIYAAMNPPYEDIQLVSSDAREIEGNKFELTVTLKNVSPLNITHQVKVTFETKWYGGNDTETKTVNIPKGESRTASAILNANPYQLETKYEITWEWQQLTFVPK